MKPTASAPAMLTVRSGENPLREFPLDPRGVLIGRAGDCAVQLDDGYISRHHARVFRDPFGRWIIEDLASRNGILVNRECVKAAAIGPGDEVCIGPFYLAVIEPVADHSTPAIGGTRTASVMVDDTAIAELTDRPDTAMVEMSRDRMRHLNQIANHLAGLVRPGDLYSEACRLICVWPKTLAAVLRLSAETSPSPEVLASHGVHLVGGEGPLNSLRLSQTVLRAVVARREVVSATSKPRSQSDLALTVVDTLSPRAVFAAPVSESTGMLEVLYLDMPAAVASPDMLEFLSAVARQVSFARKSLVLAEESARYRTIDHELGLARRIQQRLTPGLADPPANLDVAIHYQPAMWVGGDYCDLWRVPDGRVAFALGDVSGKGLPAAMLMANLQGLLRTATMFCHKPADALSHVNRQLCQMTPDDFFVTLFFALLDPASGQLEYANAGHMSPILLHGKGHLTDLGEPACPPLGVLEEPISTFHAELEPGTGLVAFSDGITEAADPQGEFFGTEGIRQHLADPKPCRAAEVVRTLTEAVSAYRRHIAQHDDLTILALELPIRQSPA
jgi:serine phosphatase RsbU (regulator of sigma subunit)